MRRSPKFPLDRYPSLSLPPPGHLRLPSPAKDGIRQTALVFTPQIAHRTDVPNGIFEDMRPLIA
jgi:hypothetical protein